MSQVTPSTLTTRSQLRVHWIVAVSALLALLAVAAVTLVLVIDNDASTTSGVPQPQAAVRSDGGPSESAVAAAVGSQPSAGPDESNIAASIGGSTPIGGPRIYPSGPDESAVAASIGSQPSAGPGERAAAASIRGSVPPQYLSDPRATYQSSSGR